jgi:hypothetical protein
MNRFESNVKLVLSKTGLDAARYRPPIPLLPATAQQRRVAANAGIQIVERRVSRSASHRDQPRLDWRRRSPVYPIRNRFIAFQTKPEHWHAVKRVHGWERLSVLALWNVEGGEMGQE